MVYQARQSNSHQGEEQYGPQRNGLRLPYVLIGRSGIVRVLVFWEHGADGWLHEVRVPIKVASYKAHELMGRSVFIATLSGPLG